ncbi:MAG TPA: tyrosine-protein phosphatase [Chlamydiales bacterium]|nr:tyrosine-protein phosphatase [Chlamydiales bacterium]
MSLQEKVESRWRAFQKGRQFKGFEAGKSDAALEDEFENIEKTRRFIWTTAGYEIAEHLILNDLVRAAGTEAFAYNNTVPYYNASTIYLGDKPYIACEGPRSKDVPNFFKLLTTHRVTHLVRLTGSYEGEEKKCHPYWEGLLSSDVLSIPTGSGVYPIHAFAMAHWKDRQGVDPGELLDLVIRVRRELSAANTLLAVHCSAGVGRTGTFLAALAVVEAIEQKTPFSIEEIVYRLSLQRIQSVSKESQYITLHRLAERSCS